MSEFDAREVARDLSDNAKTYFEYCADTKTPIETSQITGPAIEKLHEDVHEIFSSKDNARAVGLELERMDGWFSGLPFIFVEAQNGQVTSINYATSSGMSDNPYRLSFFRDEDGQDVLRAKCNGPWKSL